MRYFIMLNKTMMGIVFSLIACMAQETFAMNLDDCKKYDRSISYQQKENAEREVVKRLMLMKEKVLERLENFSLNVSSAKWIDQNDPEGYDSHKDSALKLSLTEVIEQNLKHIQNGIALANLSLVDAPKAADFLSTLATSLTEASNLEVNYKMIINHKILTEARVTSFEEEVKNLRDKQSFPKDESAACLAIYPQHNGNYPTQLMGYITN
jgi:hypothetical protein